jgi:hypothetical protein
MLKLRVITLAVLVASFMADGGWTGWSGGGW